MLDLVRALERGSYDPVTHAGQALHVEDLSCVMQAITYDTPMRNPRWWEFWKWGSKDYMYLLHFQQRETKLDLRRGAPPMKCQSCGRAGAYIVSGPAECSNWSCPNFTREQMRARLARVWTEKFDDVECTYFPPTGLGESFSSASSEEWDIVEVMMSGETREELTEGIKRLHATNAQITLAYRALGLLGC